MITIGQPTYEHIDAILALSSRYLINNLKEQNCAKGFIRIPYTREDIAKIIDVKEIVIATDDDKLIGYYLVGRASNNPALNY